LSPTSLPFLFISLCPSTHIIERNENVGG
jgi:hypothetical protein